MLCVVLLLLWRHSLRNALFRTPGMLYSRQIAHRASMISSVMISTNPLQFAVANNQQE